jgi:aspartokinase-like uncharacterized kinase
MWVVKLGGSLDSSPRLVHWLEVLARHGGGRAVIVPGGGRFADQVRKADERWQIPEAVAHRMALLAMAQYGLLLAGLQPVLVPAESIAAVREVTQAGSTPIWLPVSWGEPDAQQVRPSWRVTSDSLAAWLAGRLGASGTVLVKSVPRPPSGTAIDELIRRGIVDPELANHAREAGSDLYCLGPDDFEELTRALVDGSPCGAALSLLQAGRPDARPA